MADLPIRGSIQFRPMASFELSSSLFMDKDVRTFQFFPVQRTSLPADETEMTKVSTPFSYYTVIFLEMTPEPNSYYSYHSCIVRATGPMDAAAKAEAIYQERVNSPDNEFHLLSIFPGALDEVWKTA